MGKKKKILVGNIGFLGFDYRHFEHGEQEKREYESKINKDRFGSKKKGGRVKYPNRFK